MKCTKRMLKAMWKVAEGTRLPNEGICTSVCKLLDMDEADDWKVWAMRKWKMWTRYSGDPTFPLPGGENEFLAAHRENRMWHGQYGLQRLELLAYLINQAETEQ